MEKRISAVKVISFIFLLSVISSCYCVKNVAITDFKDVDVVIGQFVEGYHRVYYEYPKGIKDLERDLSCDSQKNYRELRNFILHNIADFRLSREDDVILITYKDSIVSVVNCTFDPCDYTYLNLPDYYREFACFDKHGLRVNSNVIIDRMKEKVRSIQSRYRKAIFVSGNNVDEFGNKDKYLFVQYTKQGGLKVLCLQDDVKLDEYQYFIDLDMYFSEIVNEFNLSKIIFATKIFF